MIRLVTSNPILIYSGQEIFVLKDGAQQVIQVNIDSVKLS